MSEHPKFIKDFSKQESQEERDILAGQIKEKRKTYFETKEEKEDKLEAGTQKTIEYNEVIQQKLIELQKLRDELENISSTLPSKIFNFLKYFKIKDKLEEDGTALSESRNEAERSASYQIKLQKSLDDTNLSDSMKEAKKQIQAFYEKQEEEWAETSNSKEDIKTFFSPEYLTTLSLGEYITLLKRFPSQMVTHVTRQGVRDHLGAVNHWAGINKFTDGFKDVVEAGTLKSAFGIIVTENAKNEEIANFLGLKHRTKEEAVSYLEEILEEESQHHDGSFADRKAVHFATEEVADAHYGAETGNEIFCAYPSALIASQYFFSGQLSKAEGGYHNNQWVFLDEKKDGLDISAGLVFIPKNNQVNRKNGSKYELDEQMQPTENVELLDKISEITSQDGFEDFVSKHIKIFSETNRGDTEKLIDDEPLNDREKIIKRNILNAQNDLKNNLGVSDLETQKIILNYDFFFGAQDFKTHQNKNFIKERLYNLGFKFKPAQDTISSEEYWENYFKDSNKKPNKIVYYEESDPTIALKKWKIKNGLTKKYSDKNLGFDEKHIDLSSAEDVKQKIPSIGRFGPLAQKVINNFYK